MVRAAALNPEPSLPTHSRTPVIPQGVHGVSILLVGSCGAASRAWARAG